MRIKVGHIYKRRDGKIVECLAQFADESLKVKCDTVDNCPRGWWQYACSGEFVGNGYHLDLVDDVTGSELKSTRSILNAAMLLLCASEPSPKTNSRLWHENRRRIWEEMPADVRSMTADLIKDRKGT